MDPTLRKVLLLGIGAASLTKKQIELQVKKLVKNGKLNTKEGEAMVRELWAAGEKHRKKMNKVVGRELKRAHGFTKDLEKRVKKLVSDVNTTKKTKKKNR